MVWRKSHGDGLLPAACVENRIQPKRRRIGLAAAGEHRDANADKEPQRFCDHTVMQTQTRRGGDKETRRHGLKPNLLVSLSPCLLVWFHFEFSLTYPRNALGATTT